MNINSGNSHESGRPQNESSTPSPTTLPKDTSASQKDAILQGVTQATTQREKTQALAGNVERNTRADEPNPTEDNKHAQAFQRQAETFATRIAQTKQELEKAEGRVREEITRYEQDGGRPMPLRMQTSLLASLERYKVSIADLTAQQSLLRPGTDADAAYRQEVNDILAARIAGSIPPGLPLRFHGAPMHKALQITESGELSSSVDRIGTKTSRDGAGEISITTATSVGLSINSFLGLTTNESMPPGCLFVLLPSSQQEEQEANDESLNMGNVDFRKNPRQLYRIVTAPENLPQIRAQLERRGLNPNLAMDFASFTDDLATTKSKIASGEVKLQDLVPYPLDSRSNE